MKNKGITLLALIVTVIIMLILASVTIKLITTGGIIDKTKQTTIDYGYQADKEELTLALVGSEDYLENSIDSEKLQENLPDWTIDEEGENIIATSKKGNKFTLKNGKVTDNIDKKKTVTSSEDEIIFKNTVTSKEIKKLTNNKETTFEIIGISASEDGEFVTTGELEGKAGKLQIVGNLQESTFEYKLEDFMKGDETFYLKLTTNGKEYIQKLIVEQGEKVIYEEDFAGILIDYTYGGTIEYVDNPRAGDGRALHFITTPENEGVTCKFSCVGSKIVYAYLCAWEPASTVWYYTKDGELLMGVIRVFDALEDDLYEYIEFDPMEEELDSQSHFLEITMNNVYNKFFGRGGGDAYLDKIIVYK